MTDKGDRSRLAILISGRGSNMEALLQAAEDIRYPAQIVAVISNRPEAPGLDKARSFGVHAHAIDHKAFGKDRQAFEKGVDFELRRMGVGLIALAGFMRVLTPWFVERWTGRLLNIHPSLLPKYPGIDTHARCLKAGDKRHGCTVHYVTPGVDEGPAIGQAEIEVRPGDTEEILAGRVLKAEHLLYPLCVAAVARGKTQPVVRETVFSDGEVIWLSAPR